MQQIVRYSDKKYFDVFDGWTNKDSAHGFSDTRAAQNYINENWSKICPAAVNFEDTLDMIGIVEVSNG